METISISAIVESDSGTGEKIELEAVSLSTEITDLLDRLFKPEDGSSIGFVWHDGKGKSTRWIDGYLYVSIWPQFELEVTEGASNFKELLINQDDSLPAAWNRLLYRETPIIELVKGNLLQFGSAQVSFQRTLRIPNDGKTYPLPAGLGPFQLFNTKDFADLPQSMQDKGGAFTAMHQSEAMWIQLQQDAFQLDRPRPTALRVFAGGVNVISGDLDLPLGDQEACASGRRNPRDITQRAQSHVCIPDQPWLDGFRISRDEVRQFVATPFGSGMSVEAQLTGRDNFGGLQLEFTPSFRLDFEAQSLGIPLTDILGSPRSYGLSNKSRVTLSRVDRFRGPLNNRLLEVKRCDTLREFFKILEISPATTSIRITKLFLINIRTLTRGLYALKVSPFETVEGLKLLFEGLSTFPFDYTTFIFAGKELKVGQSLAECGVKAGSLIWVWLSFRGGGTKEEDIPLEMSIGAGGKIQQQINKDLHDPRIWDSYSSKVVNVQLLNTQHFASITGYAPPPTPISKKLYKEQGLPWFGVYDDIILAADMARGGHPFKDIQTLHPEDYSILRTHSSYALRTLGFISGL